MKTLQVSDECHAELTRRKADAGAKRIDDVVQGLLHPVPRRKDVIARIHRFGTGLRAMGVRRIRLFGSVLHDQARSGSDIDLLIDLDDDRTYFDLARVQAALQDLLSAPVDVVLPGALHPRLTKAILAEAEDIPLA